MNFLLILALIAYFDHPEITINTINFDGPFPIDRSFKILILLDKTKLFFNKFFLHQIYNH